MREVRECDFCGADATGVYDVLPPEVGDRRMLLCDGCRTTLASAVDPLIDTLAGTDPGAELSAGGDGTAGGTTADDDSGEELSPDGAPSATRARKGAPRGYRKVVRFLENREFPLDRAEAESMVVDAYDLDHEQVAAAIDHAIKHERLREAGNELRR